jgi:TRAP-type C4-dicarboxylate transport system permease small subunit
MSTSARFDIRIPIGALFALLGVILTAYGAVTWSNVEMYARSEAIVINLWWGLAMIVFGGGMLFFGFRAPPPAARSVQGTATEERERQLGPESEK